MPAQRGINAFLTALLALQQDGKHAISAPTNWTAHEPLLQVPTEVDAVLVRLCDSIIVGEAGNKVGDWHFFVGSPGNGKSAAVGKLCRELITKHKCAVRDENGISISDLEPTAMPYALSVFENGMAYASAVIVQDASVVRNPFSATVDPAKELVDIVRTAWEKGIALVVCTNRGVLEKAHRDYHMNQAVNTTAWFKVISSLVSTSSAPEMHAGQTHSFDAKKSAFRQFRVGCTFLDNRSLVLGRNTLADLIAKATEESKWKACDECPSNCMCPFKANRDWLADSTGCGNVLRLLKRAEMLSGQIIVFREALALISLLLAGCPKDYGEKAPCDWVQDRIEDGDLFSLISRRVYMSIFVAGSPFGLEQKGELLAKQLEALSTIRSALPAGQGKARAALDHVVGGVRPSTDVGVVRLLGPGGVMSSLDPCLESLPLEFYQKWDTDIDGIPTNYRPYVSDLEKACILIWKAIEEALEGTSDHMVPEVYWYVRRWMSNCILHLGALAEGQAAWSEELDAFEVLLTLMSKPAPERTPEDRLAIRRIDDRLRELLDSGNQATSGGRIQLTDSVTLSGQWVDERLRPKMATDAVHGGVSLRVQFDGREGAVFGGPVYLWLTRRAEGRLDARCFPQELMAGIEDARIRAAARSKYAFEDNEVELLIKGKSENFVLTRIDGDVHVGVK